MADRRRPAARADELRLALALLTRLPVGRIDPAPPLAATLWALPLAGAAAGAAAAAVFLLAAAVLPAAMAATAAIGAGILVTGGLHEDGLADTADGFGGGATRARKLEIMRDSRIGSYGVLALVIVMGLRIQGLAAAPDAGAGALALIALGAASRAPLVAAMAWLPPARADGLAAGAAAGGRAVAVAGPTGGLALLLLLLPAAHLPPLTPVVLLAALIAAAGVLAALARRQVGGQTGDILGAMQQAGEAALWIVLAGAWR